VAAAVEAAFLSGDDAACEALLEAALPPGGHPGLVNAVHPATGATPLHAAARGGHAACVAALVTAGADTGARDMEEETPLHAASRGGHAACVAVLLAGPNGAAAAVMPDARGRTPAALAAARGHHAAAAALGATAVSPPVGAAARTLVLAPPACAGHATAERLGRGASDVPPENALRLDALLAPRTGALRGAEFAALLHIDEEGDTPAAMGDVLRCHEWAYVRRIRSAIAAVPDEPGFVGRLDGDTAVSAGSWAAALAAAGAVTRAVDAVVAGAAKNAFAAVRPPGHHAGPFGPVTPGEPPGSGSHGFCLLNNVAIGAAYALAVHRGALRRVAIVDFDVHHGNGTEACVEATVPGTVKLPFSTVAGEGLLRVPTHKPWLGDGDADSIFFASVHGHGRGFYPGTGATVDTHGSICADAPQEWAADGVALPSLGAVVAHPVGAPRVVDVGMSGEEVPRAGRGAAWRRVWTGLVLPALDAFKPDMIFISAGFDAHAKDDIQGCAGWAAHVRSCAADPPAQARELGRHGGRLRVAHRAAGVHRQRARTGPHRLRPGRWLSHPRRLCLCAGPLRGCTRPCTGTAQCCPVGRLRGNGCTARLLGAPPAGAGCC